jgi:hypothetical protein
MFEDRLPGSNADIMKFEAARRHITSKASVQIKVPERLKER